MGVCNATANDINTKEIDSQLKKEQAYEQKYKKLLFLGPGGSGKSTIFKQLQWSHGGGYSQEYAILSKNPIHCHIISQMKSAITHYLSDNDLKTTENKTNEIALQTDAHIDRVCRYDHRLVLTQEIAESISFIWKNDQRLKDIFTLHPSKKILDETTPYFWNSLQRISASDYVPNRMDIINTRNATIGITQNRFMIDDVKFHIFDVGGQKSERKKWINVFDEVDGIAFVTSLSCYNEVMFEDENTNCMVDAIQLFDSIINHKLFVETAIILFLNKKDLFQQKIQNLAITVCPAFTDFDRNEDPKDFIQTTEYIKKKFQDVNDQNRQIYIHITYALDNVNIKDVFDEIAQIIVVANLGQCDLLV